MLALKEELTNTKEAVTNAENNLLIEKQEKEKLQASLSSIEREKDSLTEKLQARERERDQLIVSLKTKEEEKDKLLENLQAIEIEKDNLLECLQAIEQEKDTAEDSIEKAEAKKAVKESSDDEIHTEDRKMRNITYGQEIQVILAEAREQAEQIIKQARAEAEQEMVKVLQLRAQFKQDTSLYQNWCSKVQVGKQSLEDFIINLNTQYDMLNKAMITMEEGTESNHVNKILIDFQERRES